MSADMSAGVDPAGMAMQPSGDGPASRKTPTAATARHDFLRRLKRNRGAVVAAAVLTLMILIALIGQWITPHDPSSQNLTSVLVAPGTDGFLLGTDQLGRDILSRLIVGTRVSLVAVAQALLVALILGLPPGFISGFAGGAVDTAIQRVNDAVMSFPPLLLAIALVGVLGPSLRNAMIAVGVIFAPRFLRLTRGVVMGIREETYVEASNSIGTPTVTIVRRHILPNTLSPLMVQVAVTAGYAMLAEAALSFLGLGARPPDASWGAMIREGYDYFTQSAWLGTFPGIMITITVLSFIVLGDGLRDSMGREERRE